MTTEEKTQLLELLAHEGCWCRDAEATNAQGHPVRYDDPSAVAWDLTGALCRLFGWPRACVLFCQLDRHIHGKRYVPSWPVRDIEMDAMASLQQYNDGQEIPFAKVREQIATMPVWVRGGSHPEALSHNRHA